MNVGDTVTIMRNGLYHKWEGEIIIIYPGDDEPYFVTAVDPNDSLHTYTNCYAASELWKNA